MKKEIKFRAWISETKERVNNFENDYAISELNNDFFIIEQFTGLKDKHGVEIYEGDVVKEGNYKTIVKWEFKASCSCCNVASGYNWSYGESEYLEVIGNIHANPELI